MLKNCLLLFILLLIPFIGYCNIEQKDLKVITPKDVMPDVVDGAICTNPFTGKKGWARKGIIGATEYNSQRMNQLFLIENPSTEEIKEFWQLVYLINERLDSLETLGLFDLFSPSEWVNSQTQSGRVVIGLLYMLHKNEDIKKHLPQLFKTISKPWSQEIVKLGHPLPSAPPIKGSNQKGVRETILLPDGVEAVQATNPFTGEKGYIRKGTVNAMINNVAVLNKYLLETLNDSSASTLNTQSYLDQIAKSMPSFYTTGLFQWFLPIEWVSNDEMPGKTLITLIALQQYPHLISPRLKDRLELIIIETKHELIRKEAKKALFLWAISTLQN